MDATIRWQNPPYQAMKDAPQPLSEIKIDLPSDPADKIKLRVFRGGEIARRELKTNGFRALIVFLLRAKAVSRKKGDWRTDDLNPILAGAKGSPAVSLEEAVNKRARYLGDLFGWGEVPAKEKDRKKNPPIPFLRDLIDCQNPGFADRTRPVELSYNPPFFDIAKLHVMGANKKEISGAAALTKAAEALWAVVWKDCEIAWPEAEQGIAPTSGAKRKGSDGLDDGSGGGDGGDGGGGGGYADLSHRDDRAWEPGLKLYLEGVFEELHALDLKSIIKKANVSAAQIELHGVYTELSTDISRFGAGDEKKARAYRESHHEEKDNAVSAADFAAEYDRAVLLGDPGSGKSTFAGFLTLTLVDEKLKRVGLGMDRLGEAWQKLGWRAPIHVVARDFAAQLPKLKKAGADWLWQFIEAPLRANMPEFADLMRREMLHAGGQLVLDGLDEVPETGSTREDTLWAVKEFRKKFPRARLLLTCRTYAYRSGDKARDTGWSLDGFTDARLLPFDWEQIQTFVKRWYSHTGALFGLEGPDADRQAGELIDAIEPRDSLKEMAGTPLLLTLMASLHAQREGKLPEGRARLYKDSLELLIDVWQEKKRVSSGGERSSESAASKEWQRIVASYRPEIERALQECAFNAHDTQPVLKGAADIPEKDVRDALIKHIGDEELKPTQLVNYIRDRTGVLNDEGRAGPDSPRMHKFPHRTFQEYLAACHIHRQPRWTELVTGKICRPPDGAARWREVVLLAGAMAADNYDLFWALIRRLCPRDIKSLASADPDGPWHCAAFAGQILQETKWADKAKELHEEEQDVLERVRHRLAKLLDEGHLSPRDRAQAGTILAKLGDPRPGVELVDGKVVLEWSKVMVPDRFTMGSEKDIWDDWKETPQIKKFGLIPEPFAVSRYPVTVAQYQSFVDAGGYQKDRWWTKAGLKWREKRITGPEDNRDVFQTANHPRVGVSWYEAMAFCAWLDADKAIKAAIGEELKFKGNFRIALPTEAQWERAARHTDGRLYPWGEADDVAERCNMSKSNIGHTSAVGMFPSGEAKCGARDMAGNVWEWCLTRWQNGYAGYEDKQAELNDEAGEEGRVLRGGAFDADTDGVRCAARDRYYPDSRDRSVGFRGAASPFL